MGVDRVDKVKGLPGKKGPRGYEYFFGEIRSKFLWGITEVAISIAQDQHIMTTTGPS